MCVCVCVRVWLCLSVFLSVCLYVGVCEGVNMFVDSYASLCYCMDVCVKLKLRGLRVCRVYSGARCGHMLPG